jgi:hypothetical protein
MVSVLRAHGRQSRDETARPVFSFCECFFETWLKRNKNKILLWHYSIVDEKQKCNSSIHEKKRWSTESKVPPNRDDSGHVLIMTIDIDQM